MKLEDLARELQGKSASDMLASLETLPEKNLKDGFGFTMLHKMPWAPPEVLSYILRECMAPADIKIDDLLAALEGKDADGMIMVLSALPDKEMTEKEDRDNTLLHIMARLPQIPPEVVTWLLDQGLEANALNNKNNTPLHSLAGSYRLVTSLDYLKKREEQYPWMLEKLNILLDHGANPQRKDNDGDTCYHDAARGLCAPFLAVLAQKGVKLDRATAGGDTCMHLLAGEMRKYAEDIQERRDAHEARLLIGPKEWDEDAWGKTLEKHQAETGDKLADGLELLPTLTNAALETIKALLDAGLDPEQQDSDGKTAFDLLVGELRFHELGALLKGELRFDGSPEEALRLRAGGMTLQQAVLWGIPDAIEARLELGLDVNAMDDIAGLGQGTALAAACYGLRWKEAQLLLEHGADPNARSGNGITPIAWFFANDKEQWPLTYFKYDFAGRIIRAMLASGLQIDDAVDDAGNTALVFACCAQNGDAHPDTWNMSRYETYKPHDTLRMLIIKALLKAKADVNKPGANGRTALMYASGGYFEWYTEIQMLLLEKGADVAAKDIGGTTALMFAATIPDQGYSLEMAQNLFDFGDPLPNAVNNQGKTAMDYAMEAGNETLAQYLVKQMK